jgi:general secretion pathway protein M
MKKRWQELKKRYWEAREARERRAITLAALLLSPLLIYFTLWQPAHVANNKLRVSVPDLRVKAAHLQAQAVEVEEVRHHPHSTLLDINALKTAIEESAGRHQIRNAITSIEIQQPNDVRITLASVSFEQWVGWLRSLQQEQRIRVKSTGIAPLPQKGLVKINATLTNGSAE